MREDEVRTHADFLRRSRAPELNSGFMSHSVDMQRFAKLRSQHKKTTSKNSDLSSLYATALKNANDWEDDVDNQYGEDDAMTIMGMLSYLENKERGFGHLNDEKLFQSERSSDIEGVLYEEAKKGFELSKICFQLRSPRRKLK